MIITIIIIIPIIIIIIIIIKIIIIIIIIINSIIVIIIIIITIIAVIIRITICQWEPSVNLLVVGETYPSFKPNPKIISAHDC